jgi:hypothetical protein
MASDFVRRWLDGYNSRSFQLGLMPSPAKE